MASEKPSPFLVDAVKASASRFKETKNALEARQKELDARQAELESQRVDMDRQAERLRAEREEFQKEKEQVNAGRSSIDRSEEHTSELQSQFHLVCRLLLEKKKKKSMT